MSLLGSTKGLLSTVSGKVDQLATGAKILGCLPSILSGFGGIMAGIGGAILGSVTAAVTSIISGFAGAIYAIVNDFISSITGAVTELLNLILQLQGEILGIIDAIKGFFDELEAKAADVKKFVEDEENCRFAASELIKCIASKLISGFADDLAAKAGTSKLGSKITGFLDSAKDTLNAPANFINDVTDKASSQVNKANSQIAAINLF